MRAAQCGHGLAQPFYSLSERKRGAVEPGTPQLDAGGSVEASTVQLSTVEGRRRDSHEPGAVPLHAPATGLWRQAGAQCTLLRLGGASDRVIAAQACCAARQTAASFSCALHSIYWATHSASCLPALLFLRVLDAQGSSDVLLCTIVVGPSLTQDRIRHACLYCWLKLHPLCTAVRAA